MRSSSERPTPVVPRLTTIAVSMSLYTNLQLAESLLETVVRKRSEGLPHSKDTAALKLFSSEMCNKTCSDAMLIFGANGLKKSYEIDRLLRDSKVLTIGEGTSQICKIIISNSIFNSIGY